jgi:hypothetical protein
MDAYFHRLVLRHCWLESKCVAAAQAKALRIFPKCADRCKGTMLFLCFNAEMYPPPLWQLNSQYEMHFPCHACRMIGVSRAPASFKYTRRPATLLENVPELPLIIFDILSVSNHYQRCLHGGGVGALPCSTSLEASSSHEFARPEVVDWLEM